MSILIISFHLHLYYYFFLPGFSDKFRPLIYTHITFQLAKVYHVHRDTNCKCRRAKAWNKAIIYICFVSIEIWEIILMPSFTVSYLLSGDWLKIQGGTRNVIPFYHSIKIVTSQYRCCKRTSEYCSSWKMRQMSPVCKIGDNGLLTVDEKVKVVLFYAETNSVVATQRHFDTRWSPCKHTI